jgi:hypothetical protein
MSAVPIPFGGLPVADPEKKESNEPNPAPPVQWVSTQVPLDVLIQKLKEPKDVRVMVASAGFVMAFCKACNEQITPKDKDQLLWFVCPKCKGVTFVPIANLRRDVGLAQRNGGVFEYEVWWVREFPPGFPTPPA